jgi:phosphate transport system protein
MPIQQRVVLERQLNTIRGDLLRLSSLVITALDKAMTSLYERNLPLAHEVIVGDAEINELRYKIEEEGLLTLATQQPAAIDLRTVIAGIHLAVELERIGDHAAGIAKLVTRLGIEEEIAEFYKLPKMAKRASHMVEQGVQAYIERDAEKAHDITRRDDKIDRHYRTLYLSVLQQMRDDPTCIRRATFMLWIGHNLERVGDRAINIAERVIFMVTSEFVENIDELEDFEELDF